MQLHYAKTFSTRWQTGDFQIPKTVTFSKLGHWIQTKYFHILQTLKLKKHFLYASSVATCLVLFSDHRWLNKGKNFLPALDCNFDRKNAIKSALVSYEPLKWERETDFDFERMSADIEDEQMLTIQTFFDISDDNFFTPEKSFIYFKTKSKPNLLLLFLLLLLLLLLLL